MMEDFKFYEVGGKETSGEEDMVTKWKELQQIIWEC